MSTRIDILDRFPEAPSLGNPKFIGYGYRLGHDFDADKLAFYRDRLTDRKTHTGGYKNGAWRAPETQPETPYIAEVRFRPGVTDNVATSVRSLIHYAEERDAHVEFGDTPLASGRIYAVATPDDAEALYNPLIEQVEVLPFDEWLANGFSAHIPQVELAEKPRAIEVDLHIPDDALTELSKRGIREETPDGVNYRGPLGLGLDDLHSLRAHYDGLGRNLSDIELETFAQSWSEHCKHRFFASAIDDVTEGLFKTYIKSATDKILADKPDFCLSVFHDNAGGIAFGDHVLAFKVETHNSPSALDPYGGAMTGVLGVNRDCLGFGMGAEPLANVFGYCLPRNDDDRAFFRQADGTNPLPSAPDLAEGVIKGIEEGGNHSGIPTVQGFIYEDDSFRGKPLVYCGTLGILPREVMGPEGIQSSVEKTARAGDAIYVFGNHVGYDGIHGATFSSVELDDNSPATAVQIGDPITQKNLQDVLFIARDRGLYRAITDNGAGGLSSSIGEMAEGAGGAVVWLDKVALKYPGLAPWEIWISESQERMLASVPMENVAEFEALFKHYNVSAQHIGEFADDGFLRLTYDGDELGRICMDYLHNGEPHRAYNSGVIATEAKPRTQPTPTMRDVLAMPNFQSRESLFRRYDNEVQGKSALKPLIGGVENFASILRPLWNSRRGVGLSQAMMPYLTEANPYMAGYAAVDLAVRRLIASGANPDEIAILDNFCWSKPESNERLHQLRETTRGLHDAALDFAAPIISGKDSMYNDFRGYNASGTPVEINALPSLLVSAMGLIDDVTQVQSFEFKAEGDLIALYRPNAQELTRTMIDQSRGDGMGAITDKVDHSASYASFAKMIADGTFASVEALAHGGAGYAIMRAAMASNIGAAVELDGAFAELDSGFLVTVDPRHEHMLDDRFEFIGKTGGDDVIISADRMSLNDMRTAFTNNAYGVSA